MIFWWIIFAGFVAAVPIGVYFGEWLDRHEPPDDD